MPPRVTAEAALAAPRLGGVEVGLDGALPLIHTSSDPVLASRLGISTPESRLRYRADYRVEPGSMFAATASGPGQQPPRHVGTQRLGQDVRLRLHEVWGAPVSFGISAEMREGWWLDGSRAGQQRQLASVDWAPAFARLSFQLASGAAALDPQLGMNCERRGTVNLPLATSAGAYSVRLSNRGCQLLHPDPRFDALVAEAWAVAFASSNAQRETELALAVIDANWRDGTDHQDIDSGYELGLSHRRNLGEWSTRARVGMRYAAAWDLGAPAGEQSFYAQGMESWWIAGAALTRQLQSVSLTANWSHGADPTWFMPQLGQRSQRLDMHLDLSRMVAAMIPDATPQLGLQWYWAQARSRSDVVSEDAAVRLNMGVLW